MLRDAVERVVRTFVQAALAVIGLNAADVVNVGTGKAMVTAGVAAVLTLVTSLIASRFGSAENASFLPPK